MRCLLLAFALILSAVAAPGLYAHAADTSLPGMKTPSNEPDMPSALEEQKTRGAQIYYLGKFDTLNGWVMIRTGQPEFYYATPGNKALVMGILFDEKGQMRTGEQLKALEAARSAGVDTMLDSKKKPVPPEEPVTDGAPRPRLSDDDTAPTPDANNPLPALPPIKAEAQLDVAPAPNGLPDSPATRLFAQVQGSNSVLWGKEDVPAFWAFVDPNCPHCQYFLKQVEPFVKAGVVAVHLVPMGYDDKSKQQAALVLAAGDGPARLVAYAKGQADVLPASKDISITAITANARIMQQWGLTATPMILYKSGKTGDVKLIRGRPLDINEAISDLKG